MKITKIVAGRKEIRLYTDADGEVVVRMQLATVAAKPGRTLAQVITEAKQGVITVPRQAHGDNLFSRFVVFYKGKVVGGVCHVTDIEDDVPENTSPYPQPPTIKTLSAPQEICQQLDIQQGLMNINLPHLMTTLPGRNSMPYIHNGRTYFFRRNVVKQIDEQMSRMPMTTMILLNSPRLFGSTGEKALLDACIHPGFDWDSPDAFISAFDMQTEEGQGYFGAFVEFLVERYTRPDGRYGRAVGAIISNEVTSQYVWGNAGEMPMQQYVHEYSQALRLAWLCGQKHCRHFRIYISMDQYWCGVAHNMAQPLRYYSGRPMLETLNSYAVEEGNFGWNVAYHPYPENLAHPDFWNDRAVNFTFSTPKITFHNMEVLEAFLSQPAFAYRGAPRRIIFSEQGFNSQSGPLQQLTEQQAAAGYVLAYMKARKMQTVDMMTHHSFVDNPHEFGLNLGIFRYDPQRPHNMGQPKPIFASVCAMDTDDEAAVVESARAFIGPALFDYLLDPPLVYGDRDTSQDNAFGA